ncbi:enoyl-CoA hydratase/isomerase family protein [Microbacterium sp. 5K110]|uniref:enoyl-CoA hydratase/isomerase family protein n=1 Tax=unclassified Microbacterium TaxID=2609290 RepID=UPI0010FD6C8D|nr:enoyl-CoA hydratase/isomerase family protein [Microbacterium sp. 5K110]TLF27324.1 enoyl-CoA hydratase/isomerase family protein [Microbacterium sp. 5K110]
MNAQRSDDDAVIARAWRGVGHVTLNRPRAINALDLGMIRRLAVALDRWENDSDVDLVLLDGAGDRGFCAGGDVRALYDFVVAGQVDEVHTFFREEYALNHRIATYPKPIVAIADGVTMGGGIGLAGHARIRIVTERSRLAMPETRIGFSPDVGGSWLLGRAPGRLGEYLGLTGATMDAADALYAGFADHLVPVAHLSALHEALQYRADPSSPTELVLLFDESPERSDLETWRPWIDDAFSADDLGGILYRLRRRWEPEAHATADLLESSAPTAVAVTLEAVRRARTLPSLRAALAQEYGLVMWFATTQPDLAEGIRAQLVDKDRSPSWSPSAHANLPAGRVGEAFAFDPDPALW